MNLQRTVSIVLVLHLNCKILATRHTSGKHKEPKAIRYLLQSVTVLSIFCFEILHMTGSQILDSGTTMQCGGQLVTWGCKFVAGSGWKQSFFVPYK